ncbi:uncharacterized protein HMPREF1541_03909 [Cyphellophora europaea CBS 101466]|uniref:Uncharacterized protein n=1 Tax=Cyphellophora europaea (strain CBS 101466) TaxID=1220924 RepID=W2S053_CYPE1|nr:uncharacterized protein HMPREF1541_03909 [Cyphellophora europaea CBS 101466]ETN41970.1 hypothetical protein HMPREF1541_03909 [Cyphellophora europaea CBS 101466]
MTSPRDTGQGDPDLSHAIAQSIWDEQARQARSQERRDSVEPEKSIPDRSPDSIPHDPIKAMTMNVDLRLGNEFTPIADEAGDTLIYIGIPPPLRDQSRDEYTHIRKHFDTFFLVKSSDIKALHSSKFDKLLGATPCIRAETRFKKLDTFKKFNPSLKARVKYHVDLRPPNEDDEAVLLITDLSCSYGIRAWHLAQDMFDLPPSAVAGTDHLDYPSNPYYLEYRRAREGPYKIGDLPLATEYCPLRHHSGLERLFNAMTGGDPKLDSAPKMWTYFALARYFGCAQSPQINKWILQWLQKTGNANFVQNNPEIGYRIGLACVWPDLTRDSFAVLVGEKALMDVCHQFVGQVANSDHSMHGRPLEILDDDERNRVGHAASSMVVRLRRVIDTMVLEPDWLGESPAYQKLLQCAPRNDWEAQIVQVAQQAVVDFVKYRLKAIMIKALVGTHDHLRPAGRETQLPHAKHSLFFVDTYNNLPYLARPFTRSFWMAVAEIDFKKDVDLRLDNASAWDGDLAEQKNTIIRDMTLEPQDRNRASAVDRKIMMVNDLLYPPKPIFPEARSNTYNDPGAWDGHSFAESQISIATNANTTPLLQQKREQIGEFDPGTSPGKRRKTSDDGPALALPIRPAPAPTTFLDERPAFTSTLLNTSPEKRTLFASRSSGTSPIKEETATTTTATPRSNISWPHMTQKWPSIGSVFGARSNLPQPAEDGFSHPDDAWNSGVFGATPGDGLPDSVRPGNSNLDGVQLANMASQESAGSWDDPTEGKALKSKWSADLGAGDPDHLHVDWESVSKAPKMNPKKKPERRVLQQFSDLPYQTQWSYGNQINFVDMMIQFSRSLRNRAQEIVYPAHIFHESFSMPTDLIDHVFCLTDEEWKFLPLSVGGFDDGTGGVFDETIPNLEAGGFRGGKRGIGKVDTATDDSESGSSSFDDVASEAVSTVGKASKIATDGTETVKSFDNDQESDTDFDYTDLYGQVQQMHIEQALKEAEKGGGHFLADSDDGDVSTIMGAGSDVQGHFFGDDADDFLNEDDGDNIEESSKDSKGKYAKPDDTNDDDDDDDTFELVDI